MVEAQNPPQEKWKAGQMAESWTPPKTEGPGLGRKMWDRLKKLRESSPGTPMPVGAAPNNEAVVIDQKTGQAVIDPRTGKEMHPFAGDTTQTALDKKLADAVRPVEMTKDGKPAFGADLYGSAPKLGADVVTGTDPVSGEVTSKRNILAGDTTQTALDKKLADAVRPVEITRDGIPVFGTDLYGKAPTTHERTYESQPDGLIGKRNEMVGDRAKTLFGRTMDKLKRAWEKIDTLPELEAKIKDLEEKLRQSEQSASQ